MRLLLVGDEVLDRRDDALLLHAADLRRRHLARKEAVLREILAVPAAEGGAMDICAGGHRSPYRGMPVVPLPQMPSSPIVSPYSSTSGAFQVEATTGSQQYVPTLYTAPSLPKLVKPVGPSYILVSGTPRLAHRRRLVRRIVDERLHLCDGAHIEKVVPTVRHSNRRSARRSPLREPLQGENRGR